jgi:hypothetical protein
MGIKLVEEVMDWCPDDVTPAQRWCLTVLARDANDVTRETFHGPEHPEILRRVRMSPKRWESVRSELLRRGLIEPVSGGFRGRVGRYRIASLFAPCVVRDWRKTPGERGAFGSYQPVEARKDPRNPGVNASESPSEPGGLFTESPPERRGQSTERPPESGGPTPPSFSSQPPSSPQPPAEEPEPAPEGREGGRTASRQQDNPAYLALARIAAKHPQLGLGETELADLIPLVETWLRRTTAERMEQAITAGAPADVISPVGFIRGRLAKKLPPPLQAVPDQDRCGRPNCDPVTHMVTLPDGEQTFCAVCHSTGRAIARRQQGTAA